MKTIAPKMETKNPGQDMLVVVKLLKPLAAQPPKNDPIIPTIISPSKPRLSLVIQPATIPMTAPNKIQMSKFIFPPPIILYAYYMLNSLYSITIIQISFNFYWF